MTEKLRGKREEQTSNAHQRQDPANSDESDLQSELANIRRGLGTAKIPQTQHLTPNAVLTLQRTLGNRYVQRLLAQSVKSASGTTGTVQRGKDKDIAGFDRATIPTNIHQGQQDKHIKTSSNYKNAAKGGVHKSVMTADPATLLANFHTDQYTVLAYDARRQSAVVDFDSDIGEVVNESDGTVQNTTKYGSVRFGKSGVHIIPINYTP